MDLTRRLMRFLRWSALFATAMTVLAGCTSRSASPANGVEIVRVWTNFREAQSFSRFGDFREQDTEPGDPIIVRSQPEERTGYYFTIRLRARGSTEAVPAGKLVLDVVAPDAAEARRFEFPVDPAGARSTQVLAGLTGSDWPHGAVMPLAWRLQWVDRAGTVVADTESFLWVRRSASSPEAASPRDL